MNTDGKPGVSDDAWALMAAAETLALLGAPNAPAEKHLGTAAYVRRYAERVRRMSLVHGI